MVSLNTFGGGAGFNVPGTLVIEKTVGRPPTIVVPTGIGCYRYQVIPLPHKGLYSARADILPTAKIGLEGRGQRGGLRGVASSIALSGEVR